MHYSIKLGQNTLKNIYQWEDTMQFIKLFFTLLVLLTIIFLIFKFSFWSISLILILSILFLLIDIFRVKA